MKAVEMVTNDLGTSGILARHFFGNSMTDIELGLKPNKRYAVIAIEIPDGYRLVTEDEKKKYRKPVAYYTLGYLDLGFLDNSSSDGVWSEALVYAVPISHVWEEDKPVKKPVTLELTDEQLERIKEIIKEH